MDAPSVAGEVINLATGTRVSLNRLYTTLQSLTHSKVSASYGPARACDVRDSQADISKARRLLGFEPRTTLDEGLSRTVEWIAEGRR